MTFLSSGTVFTTGLAHAMSHKVCYQMALDTAQRGVASPAKVAYTRTYLSQFKHGPCSLFSFQFSADTRAPRLQVHHTHSRSTMFRNQIRQIFVTVYSPADSRAQIKPSSPASGTCMPSAAPWTDPSPSGSARTPGYQRARMGRATAHARVRPTARGRPGGRGRQWRVLLAYRAACGCFPCRRTPRWWGTCGAGAGRRLPRRRRWRGPARRRPR